MLSFNQLLDDLTLASVRHRGLRKLFAEFATFLEKDLTRVDVPVKGISVTLELETDYFEIQFAGRVIHVTFSSRVMDKDQIGVVSCFIYTAYPEGKFIDVCGFTFTGKGETDLLMPPKNESLYLNWDVSAEAIAFHLIHAALSK